MTSSINNTDNKSNNQESHYKKCRVYRCSGNIVITNCTSAILTKTLHEISQAVLEVYLKWNTICFLQIISNYYL